MKHPIRVSVTVALIASALQGAYLTPAFAQPSQVEMRKVGTRVMAEMALPNAQIESIDANARTVSLRTFQLAPGTAPIETPDGGTQIKMVAGNLETVPLASQATFVREENGLMSDVLEIGDVVSLLGQKTAPGQVKIQVGNVEPNVMQRQAPAPQLPAILQNLGSARFGSKAENFRVVSLNPLTLRKGGEPNVGSEESVLSVPFSNGPDAAPIGTLSVGTAQMSILLGLGRGDATQIKDLRQYRNLDGTKPVSYVPVTTANYVVTLKITKVENLEFDRFRALKLSDVAADFALGKIRINPKFGQSPDGQREITRMVVSNIK